MLDELVFLFELGLTNDVGLDAEYVGRKAEDGVEDEDDVVVRKLFAVFCTLGDVKPNILVDLPWLLVNKLLCSDTELMIVGSMVVAGEDIDSVAVWSTVRTDTERLGSTSADNVVGLASDATLLAS